MGGHGALKLAMRHADLYGAVYAMAPAWTVLSESILKVNREPFTEFVSQSDPKFGAQHWKTQAFIAYAAAVSPNPDAPPFYADFPLRSDGEVDQTVWEKWLQHDLCTSIQGYRQQLLSLRGIGMCCGTEDDLLGGIRILSDTLKQAGIEHLYQEHAGGHVDRTAESLRDRVLPFFATKLSFELAAAPQAMPPDRDTSQKVETAKTQMGTLRTAIRIYQLDIGSSPSTEQGLGALRKLPEGLADPNRWYGPYLRDEVPLDPWSNKYSYERLRDDGFRLTSAGPDGMMGTKDDIRIQDE
jgi:type II secretion system protein G